MTDLQTFCARHDLDEAAVRQVIGTGHGPADAELSMAWYVRIFVGLAAWVTAMLAVSFGNALLGIILQMEDALGLPFALLGGLYLGLGLWLLRRQAGQLFITQLAVALAAAGVFMTAVGIGYQTAVFIPGITMAGIVLAGLVALVAPSRLLQFLASLFAAVALALYLHEGRVNYFMGFASLATPLGVALLLHPPRRDLRPTAVVLLLLVPLVSAVYGSPLYLWLFSDTPVQAGAGIAKALHIGVFLWLVAMFAGRLTLSQDKLQLAAFAVCATAVSLLLPPGGSAALVIMFTAFLLGSRPLALLGVLLQIYYLWRFYYDLQMTLLDKSLVLMAAGLVLLALWGLLVRHRPAAGGTA